MKTATGPRAVAIAAILLGMILPGSSAAGPIAQSTFDTGDEDWKVVSTLGYQGPVTWSATGGNPDGFIYGIDPDTGAWAFSAPQKFLGDVSAAYGHPLHFDIAAYQPPEGDTSWVGIEGAGYQFIHFYDTPDTVYPDWYTRTVWMSETGWFDPNTNDPATQAQIMAVLSDLDGLVVLAEFVDGLPDDISGLDNVVLVPEPSTLFLSGTIAVGLLAFATRKRRRR